MKIMDILELSPGEPFSVGLDVQNVWTLARLDKSENFCLLLVEKGTAEVEVDFCPYELGRNSVLIVGKQFLKCTGQSVDFSVSFITFSIDIWHEVTTPFNSSFLSFLKKYPLLTDLSDDDIAVMTHMLNASGTVFKDKENSFRCQVLKNFLQNFLMMVYEKTKARFLNRKHDNTTRQEELLEQFIALIFEYAAVRRDVQFYAGRMCITRHYLTNVVQRLTGQSPKSLIDTRSIQEIKMLLRTTTLSIQEISNRLEFPDQSFFARYFRKHTGMSPGEYREKER